jgi:hypothetical protein
MYMVDATGGMITVTYGGKGRVAQLSASAPAPLARTILRELVEKL